MFVRCLLTIIMLNMPVIATAQDEPLLPEVSEILIITFDEQTMDNNAYVALQGLFAPVELDYKNVAKEYTLAAIKRAQLERNQSKNLPVLKLKSYYQNQQPIPDMIGWKREKIGFPCYNLTNHHCVKETVAKYTALQQTIAENIPQNKVLLERYQQIIKLPNYEIYTSDLLSIPLADLRILQQIRLVQAIALIEKNRVEQGFDLLQQEIEFSKRLLTSKNGSIEFGIGIIRLADAYHVMGELLDSPKLANYLTHPKLLALLKPLTTQEQQAIVANYIASYRNSMITSPFIHSGNYKKDYEEFASKELKDYMSKHNIPVKLHKNMLLNMLYQSYQPTIKKIQQGLPNAAEIEQSLVAKEDNNQHARYDNLYKTYGADNFLTAFYTIHDNTSINGHRLYNLQSYLALVNAKLKLKQAAINKDQVADFLTKLGQQAANPYTKQPFTWQPEKQILATTWFKNHSHYSEWAGEQAELYIDFAN